MAKSIETTLLGPIEIMRHYIPHMKDQGWGRLLNIATFSAKNPMIWRLMSGPARSALINYTASVSREIAQYGVNINNILPGMFATEGSEENAMAYADAFGLEHDHEDAGTNNTTKFRLALRRLPTIWRLWPLFFVAYPLYRRPKIVIDRSALLIILS